MTSPSTHYARCPGCRTVFRVSEAQLALREGQVRCGTCRAVFDANKERVGLDSPRAGEPDEQEQRAADETAVTPSTAEAPEGAQPPDIWEEPVAESVVHDDAETAAADAVDSEPSATATLAAETDANESATAATESTEPPIRIDDGGSRSERFQWKPRKSLRERPKALYTAAIVLLLVALAAQALFEYRDAIAARARFTRPVLESACAIFGCTVEPLRDAAALSIDASDLRGDPAHRGLLKLSATIRNRASYPIAWPYLELTLTDSSDRVVARRALAPSEYVNTASGASPGLPPNGEEVVTLFLDATGTSQSGYRLYLFYP